MWGVMDNGGGLKKKMAHPNIIVKTPPPPRIETI